MKKLFMVKSNPINQELCPICNTKLASCHIGEYCPKDGCRYADGYAWLNKKEAKKYKDLILK